ncbi:MAG: hypothetical protein K8S99_02410 [Planctomycetes bacterium]|nr:hypothetical protein [Planctomycetota bacterium]
MSGPKPSTDGISDALRADLAMVLPEIPCGGGTAIEAMAGPLAEALSKAKAPVIAGLGTMSIEAVIRAVELMRDVRGRVLPWPLTAGTSRGPMSVTQTATLGHVFASDLVIWVGCTGADGPIAEAISSHQLRAALAPPTLEAVLGLRAALATNPRAEPIGNWKRVAVVLAPGCDERVVSQWHRLAAHVQQSVRVAVIQLPDIPSRRNIRGACEVITMLTSLSCDAGGVDFADGTPRPCPDVATLLSLNAIDLLIDTTPSPIEGLLPPARHVRLNPSALMAVPSAARVMRFDGVMLRLADDPDSAPPDPAAMLFSAVRKRLGGAP